jgi:lipoprotein-anchoring transpeptidase ErfK/SrfK
VRRALVGLVLVLALGLLSAAPAGAVAPSQQVVTLSAKHGVSARPGGRAEATISGRRPITGEATTLPVLTVRKALSSVWLRVRLPGRLLPGAPNGRTGWIRAGHTRLWAIRWHIVVSLQRRVARIYDGGRPRRTYRVVVGAPTTPTPTGQFFVEENVVEPPTFPGAPYALALSARSNVFTEFDGGPGQVALHGVGGGLGGTLGTAESHGCVRFATAAISWLAARIYPGTPVTITP